MNTEERVSVTEQELDTVDAPFVTTAPGAPTPMQLAPRATVDLRGTLACGGVETRAPRDLAAICGPALTDLVRQVIVWMTDTANPDARLGDYRFLVVEFTDAAGVCRYAQIWSEPGGDITMEVGPGYRDGDQLADEVDRIRGCMTGRGFAIGGAAANYRKYVAGAPQGEARQVAAELLALLTQVLGYDGTRDLEYRLHQESHLIADHVVRAISQEQLREWLARWGLRPQTVDDVPGLIFARDRDVVFRVLLRVPTPTTPLRYWEVHCVITVPFDNAVAASVLAEVNAQPNLFRVFAADEPGATTQDIGIAIGINLAGGVTPAHLRSQILEWLDGVRGLRQRPAPMRELQAPALPRPILN